MREKKIIQTPIGVNQILDNSPDKEQKDDYIRASYKIIENNSSKLTKITGILTSNLRTKKSSNIEYMAFFRPERDCEEHPLSECEATKCQKCEIPVVFKIDNPDNSECCNYQDNWHNLGCKEIYLKPKLKKGDSVILEGEFSPSEKSNRPSFTCYSYQTINDHE